MTHLRPIILVAVLALFASAAPASANYRVGIGDQSPAMFANPAFQDLKLKRTRYLVPWDWYRYAYQRGEIEAFMSTARSQNFQVLVTFTARRGCWVNNRYKKGKGCKAPSPKAYKSSFKKFRQAYPWAKLYAAWNEGNHASQPTFRSPKRAAQYYNALRKACKKCTIMAADVLDSSNARPWLLKFRRHAKGKPKLWGLHNYQDVNRRRTSGTRRVLSTVPGQVWMTETGGIVSFGRTWKYNETRAANRTKQMFRLADAYDSRRRGMKSRITRVYIYSWVGAERGTRFDAGLTDPDGSVRKAYATVKRFTQRRWK